ncbi:MAG: tyrosine-protein phosphatase [Oligoflexales bacterium]
MKIRIMNSFIFSSLFLIFLVKHNPVIAEQDWEMIDGGGLWDLKTVAEVKSHFKKFSVDQFSFRKYNFGVVVNNSRHRLYRSKALGELGTRELFSFLQENNLLIPNLVIFMNKQGYKQPSNLSGGLYGFGASLRIEDGVFAFEESQIFSKFGARPEVSFYHPLNSPVYLSGQDVVNDSLAFPIDAYVDQDIKKYFEAQIRKSGTGEHIVAKKDNFYFILKLVLESRDPVLFHCTGGRHRTGMIAMAIRYIQGSFWTKSFRQEIKVRIPNIKHLVGLRNLAEIEYYLHNKRYLREKNLESLRALSQEARFKVLVKKFGPTLNAK